MKLQANMKSTHMFRDQVNSVTNWFRAWNECEQTVALYSLLKKINPTQAKFLLQVLHQTIADHTEIQHLEREANNPAYIGSLCSQSKENAVTQLLAHLPLLRPGNNEAKVEYLKIIPKVLTHSIENGIHIEESRQLLSYSLIHPAINSEERSQFTLWLGHLEERYTASVQQARLSRGDSSDSAPPFSPYLDKNGTITNGSSSGFTVLPPQSAGLRGINGWQTPGTRDSGIGSETNAASLHSLGLLGNGSMPPPAGRPIIAASTATSTVSTSNGNLMSSGAGDANGMTTNEHVPLHATISGPASFNSSVPTSQGGSHMPNLHRKLSRSASITPPISMPGSNVSDWLNAHHDDMVQGSRSQGNNNNSEGHAPLSPQSSITSSGSGSDTHPDDPSHLRNTFLEERSGMKDVPIWLKNLRLHKYSYLFQEMTYEDMMSLTEEWLESQNVTKGARRKIILNINILKERQNVLKSMEKEIMESGSIKQALTEIKSMMNTPIKAYSPKSSATLEHQTSTDSSSSISNIENTPPMSPTVIENDSTPEGDVPGQIVRVLGKVCTQLLVTNRPDDDCFAAYLQLLDRCMTHEAFTMKQKKLLSSWKQQIQKIWNPPPQRYNLDKQRKGYGNTFPLGSIGRQRPVRGTHLNPGQTQWTFNKRPLIAPPVPPGGLPLYRNNSLNTAFSQPQIFDVKQQVQRTHSAPNKSSQFGLSLAQRPMSDMNVPEPEINARLDSLCLSMTEHALGSFDNLDHWSTF